MPIQTNTLAWWDVKLPGWRCAQCDQRLGDGMHDCPVDSVEASPLLFVGPVRRVA